MPVTASQLEEAKRLANTHYETWGQWVIECMTDAEIIEELITHKSLDQWVRTKQDFADYVNDIRNA